VSCAIQGSDSLSIKMCVCYAYIKTLCKYQFSIIGIGLQDMQCSLICHFCQVEKGFAITYPGRITIKSWLCKRKKTLYVHAKMWRQLLSTSVCEYIYIVHATGCKQPTLRYIYIYKTNKQNKNTNSVALSLLTNNTDQATFTTRPQRWYFCMWIYKQATKTVNSTQHIEH
jgi:hypothetical protein